MFDTNDNVITSPTGHTYRLLRQIGRGAFGNVYMGLDENNNQVAIKRIALQDPTQFGYEVGAHKLVSSYPRCHPNIVCLREAWTSMDRGDQREGILVLELMESTLEDRELTYQELGLMIGDVLSALAFIHSNHLAHSDIKPANILYTNPTYPIFKVSDLGLTCSYQDKSLRQCYYGEGTPIYMSPVSFTRSTRLSSAEQQKEDMWAFGITLLELLTGEVPFRQYIDRNITITQDMVGAKLNPMERDLPAVLIELLVGLLQVNPDFRSSSQSLLDWYKLVTGYQPRSSPSSVTMPELENMDIVGGTEIPVSPTNPFVLTPADILWDSVRVTTQNVLDNIDAAVRHPEGTQGFVNNIRTAISSGNVDKNTLERIRGILMSTSHRPETFLEYLNRVIEAIP